MHEKYISGLDTGTDDDLNDHNNQRVILFTDLKQANAPADAVTVTLVNVPVTASRIDTLGMAINDSRDYENGEYDHDGNPDTDLVTGEFLCPDPSACSITVQGGEVTSISGYRFTSEADEIIVPAVVSTEDTTWLAFGVWLTEMVVGDGTNTYDFGAFADGGNAVANADSIGGVTGDATYRGKAAGVHSTADAVDFFHADATLTAEFGDGTANGTITGSIHDIVAAGRSVTGSIDLVVADPGADALVPNIDDDGSFDGRARMHDTGEDDSSGEDIYRYTGTWAGNFYNHMADDDDTDDVMENTRGSGFGCRHLRRRPGGRHGHHGCGRDRELRGCLRCALRRQQLQPPRLSLVYETAR